MRYVSQFFEEVTWPSEFGKVRATAIVLAREAERKGFEDSNANGANLQPVYPLLVEDLAEALGYATWDPQRGEVPF